MKMEAIFLTDVGKIRPHNEDDGDVVKDANNNQLLALVADGMGGHQAGEVASRTAKEFILKKWDENDKVFTPKEAEKWLEETIQQANVVLYERAQNNPEYEGMGTTLVVAICSEQFVTVAHVGDSRIYLKTDDAFKQLTLDHSLVGELVRNGQITEAEALHHPRKNVLLRALGTEQDVKVDIETIHWEPGNYLLLCSDGLTNKILNDELNEQFTEDISLKDIGERLIHMANERGGEDNISLAIVFYDGVKDVAEDEQS